MSRHDIRAVTIAASRPTRRTARLDRAGDHNLSGYLSATIRNLVLARPSTPATACACSSREREAVHVGGVSYFDRAAIHHLSAAAGAALRGGCPSAIATLWTSGTAAESGRAAARGHARGTVDRPTSTGGKSSRSTGVSRSRTNTSRSFLDESPARNPSLSLEGGGTMWTSLFLDAAYAGVRRGADDRPHGAEPRGSTGPRSR